MVTGARQADALLLIVCAFFAFGCAATSSRVLDALLPDALTADQEPTDADALLARVLPSDAPASSSAAIWSAPLPSGLRPCCVLGSDLGVMVGTMPILGLKIHNIVDSHSLGRHAYDAALVSFANPLADGFVTPERNGIVYTCRGGFIDVAHVRDFADLTVYLTRRILDVLARGGEIPLPKYGGNPVLYVDPVDARILDEVGEEETAIRIAGWAAFQVSLWHEAATWFGWSHYGAIFPETASAFSPEDSYSNLLGIYLASAVLRSGAVSSEVSYEATMDFALPRLITALDGLSERGTEAAIRAIDGRWWNSQERLPARDVVLHRNFDIGPLIRPWRLDDLAENDATVDATERECVEHDPSALPLEAPTDVAGTPVRALARLRIRVDRSVAKSVAPVLDDDGRLDDDHIPDAVTAAHRDAVSGFGEGSDMP